MFYRSGAIEAWGRGFKLIFSESKLFKIPEPVITAHAGGIQIVFNKKNIVNEDINEDINAVFILIKKNGGIKAKNIAMGVMKPKKTINRYLKKLKDIGKIEYRGSNKTGGEDTMPFKCN